MGILRRAEPRSNGVNELETEGEREPLLQTLEELEPSPVTPLPVKQIAVLWLMRLGEPIAMTVIYPFINQMIEDSGVAHDPKRVGIYAGTVESLFACTSFVTILIWGRLSDRIGRKPILMFGLVGLSLSVALFGISESFYAMVLTRCLGGALNGNTAVLKSVMGELTDESNQGRAFAVLPLAWSLGSIAGPLFGGYLSHPATRYPGVFGSSAFLIKYPYALPCFLGAAFPALASILGFFFLEETLQSKSKPPPMPRRRSSSSGTHAAFVATTSTTIPAPLSNSSQITLPPPSKDDDEEGPPPLTDLMTRNVFAVLLVYCALALETVALDALLVLFCYSRVSLGGLGWDESDIGQALSASGVLAVGAQVILFPVLQQRFGTVKVYRAGMSLYPVVFALFPVMNWLARRDLEDGRDQTDVWIVMLVFLALKSTANIVYGCNMLAVTSAAPSRRLLGSLNGVAQMGATLMRAIGPFLVSFLFVLSIEKSVVGGKLVFLVMIALAIAGFAATFLLKEGVSGWREVKEVEPAERAAARTTTTT